MIDNSLANLYDYLCNVFSKVSKNIYVMNIPTSIQSADSKDGFLVIMLNTMRDNSEMALDTYCEVRVNVTMFIPPKKRSRVDLKKYAEKETLIDNIIKEHVNNDKYTFVNDDVLKYDDFYNVDNVVFNMFVRSFKIIIN